MYSPTDRRVTMSTIDPYVVSFNCGREIVQPERFAAHLFEALPTPQKAPDILVLALQEVAPIAYSFLGGSYLVPYLSAFHHAVSIAASSMSASYVNVITRNVGMTVLLVFVLSDQTAQVRRLETAGVGVGVHETGHKGAVAVRIGYSIGDSMLEICFVSAHLAPMEDGLQRRNEDWEHIVRGLVFVSAAPTDPQRLPQEHSNEDTTPLLSSQASGNSVNTLTGIYTSTSHMLLAGDLNYRTSSTKPTPDSHLTYPQPCEDTSYPQHFWHLLDSDQLGQEMRAQRTCHGLREAPIDFPPTYKYSDRGRANASKKGIEMDEDGQYWDWAKHRWPSWCDRVLYLELPAWMKVKGKEEKIRVQGYKALPLMQTSDHRPVACSFSIPALAIPEPSEIDEVDGGVRIKPPFELNPVWKERRAAARRREMLVGIGAYLALTWEGRGILVALLVGALAGWIVIERIV